MVGILVFANWGAASQTSGFFAAVFAAKWWLTSTLAVVFAAMLLALVQDRTYAHRCRCHCNGGDRSCGPRPPDWPFLVAVLGLAWLTAGRDDEAGEWFNQAWSYTKQIVPLLLGGVLVAGFLLGRPGHEGLIPSGWISGLVGGNSIAANAFAAVPVRSCTSPR